MPARHALSALEVIELVAGRSTGVVTLRSTVFNQRKKLVLEGMQKFLIASGRFSLAPSHSITLSALASSVAGTVSPSVFAVLRLMESSNLVAW